MDVTVCWNAKINDVEIARVAEDNGIAELGVGQGPLIFSDPFQYLALASQITSTLRLGTLVIDPVTRIAPSVANSLATLNALAPGRVFYGVGTANNAMHSMGRKSASPAELAETVQVVRSLVHGERVEHRWRGEARQVELLAVNDGTLNVRDKVDVYVAAGGPKGLRNAAAYADALVYCVGPDANMVRMVRAELDRLVAEAGRPPGSVRLIGLTWFYRTKAGEDWEDAVKKGFGTTAPMASTITDMGFLKQYREQIGIDIVDRSIEATRALIGAPEVVGAADHLEQWKNYGEAYDPRHARFMSKELIDFWCMYGDDAEIRDKAQLMLDSGIDSLCLTLYNPRDSYREVLADIGRTLV